MQVVEKKRGLTISQKDNYAGNFGNVLRSSAIFWAKNDKLLRTVISFTNYWKTKNHTEVAVIINVRDLKGHLVAREKVDFEQSEVCNFTPPEEFEGTVEIEVFALKNLRIPYAAIMAIYETPEGISMVHSYSRVYSQHEIEEARTISVGHESCWTVRESDDLQSFAVFHNGATVQPAQTLELRVRNYQGGEYAKSLFLRALDPFETIVIVPEEHIPGLANFLGGQPGNARLSFQLAGSFTRMLCGIRTRDGRDLQVTHSNFDYSRHSTDHVAGPAYMRTPDVPSGLVQELIVYPDSYPGSYLAESDDCRTAFGTGEIVRRRYEDHRARVISFCRTDGPMPARIVTAFRLYGEGDAIPAECSLGVMHNSRPPKSSAWMVVSQKFASTVCWTDLKEIYGGCPDDAVWECALYSPARKDPLLATLCYGNLGDRSCLSLEEIFGAFDLGGDFGYLIVRSSYGGMMMFSTMQKGRSITIEHAF